jgi:integrase/recombinase XerC
VVLRGPTARGAAHRGWSAPHLPLPPCHLGRYQATRVRPHRPRHTYGTELAAAGIDLLVLRELMGHVSPETTAGDVAIAPWPWRVAQRPAD